MTATQKWLDRSTEFCKLAERAKENGDMGAFVELITVAAKCVHIARLFERIDEIATAQAEGR
jgi:hypothetical protein